MVMMRYCWYCQWGHGLLLCWWTLPLLLLITNPSCFGLQITNLTKVKPHSSSSKWVDFRFPSIFFKSSTQTTYERVEATPSLSQRAWTWCWRVRVPIEGTHRCVNFRLAKLVQVPIYTITHITITFHQQKYIPNWYYLLDFILETHMPAITGNDREMNS